MKRHGAREWVVPAYLLACILLGGSPQGVWGTLALQLGAIALFAWAALTPHPEPLSRAARSLVWLLGLAVMLMALQLLPLPPAIWTALPGRETVAAGYRLVGHPLPWLPISLAPYATVESLLFLLPSLAIVAAMVRLRAFRSSYIAGALAVGMILNIALGAVQVSSGGGYLFRTYTSGVATGFFANGNYLGTLLLTSIPFIGAALARQRREQAGNGRPGGAIIVASLLLVAVVGIALSLSLAALLLLLPVAGATLLLFARRGSAPKAWVPGAAGLAGVLAVALAIGLPAFDRASNSVSFEARQEMYRITAGAVGEHLPLGSGFGSFPRVYAREESTVDFAQEYANHAHNDYLEIALEGGLPAILLLLAGGWWWALRLASIWGASASGSFARAATIASAAILLHSLVDFPARTIAISAVLAMCLALMAEPRPRRLGESELARRPARHLTL